MDKHIWEMDLRKHGSHGIRKLNPDTGQEDIRTKPIPTESAKVKRLKDIIDGKQGKRK